MGTPPPLDIDQQLMLRFQRGDDVAFDELYQRIRRVVLRLTARLLGDPQAAEEAAQEVLVKVYRARRTYRPQARFRTWLYRVTVNHCLNERRRAWRRFEVLARSPDDAVVALAPIGASPAAQARHAELAAAVESALQKLPPRQRAAVILARFEGCSMQELAQVLDVSVGAAKVLLHRARARLTKLLSPFLSDTTREPR